MSKHTLNVSVSPIRWKRRMSGMVENRKPRSWAEVPASVKDQFASLCHGEDDWPLYMWGTTGTGKTCAALTMFDRVEDAEFWMLSELVAKFDRIKKGIDEFYLVGETPGVWTLQTWKTHVHSWPLLVIDDILPPEVHSDEQEEALFFMTNAREGRPMICTSNRHPEEVKDLLSDRIYSRTCLGTVFQLEGSDRRGH